MAPNFDANRAWVSPYWVNWKYERNQGGDRPSFSEEDGEYTTVVALNHGAAPVRVAVEFLNEAGGLHVEPPIEVGPFGGDVVLSPRGSARFITFTQVAEGTSEGWLKVWANGELLLDGWITKYERFRTRSTATRRIPFDEVHVLPFRQRLYEVLQGFRFFSP